MEHERQPISTPTLIRYSLLYVLHPVYITDIKPQYFLTHSFLFIQQQQYSLNRQSITVLHATANYNACDDKSNIARGHIKK